METTTASPTRADIMADGQIEMRVRDGRVWLKDTFGPACIRTIRDSGQLGTLSVASTRDCPLALAFRNFLAASPAVYQDPEHSAWFIACDAFGLSLQEAARLGFCDSLRAATRGWDENPALTDEWKRQILEEED